MHFVVIDLGAEHAVEFSREEMEPLLSMPKARGAGAFAATGEPEAAIRDAVRRSSRPPRLSDLQAHDAAPPAETASSAPQASQTPRSVPSPVDIDMPFAELKARPRAASQPIAAAAPVRAPSQPKLAAVRSGSQSAMAAVRSGSQSAMAAVSTHAHAVGSASAAAAAPVAQPKPDATRQAQERESGEQERAPSIPAAKLEASDAMLAGIASGLRAFPEVEWACVLTDAEGGPAIGVRIDPSFMARAAEITSAVMQADVVSQGFSVLLLNSPELVKHARKHGHTFYPWKR